MVSAEPPPNSSISCADISWKALLFMDFVWVLPKLEQFNLQYVTVHNGNVNEMVKQVLFHFIVLWRMLYVPQSASDNSTTPILQL